MISCVFFLAEVGACPSPRSRIRESTDVSQRFVKHNGRGVREVQRSYGTKGRNAVHLVWETFEQRFIKANAFFAEDECIAGAIVRFEVAFGRDSAEKVDPSVGPSRGEVVEVGMCFEIDEVPVVDTSAANRVFVNAKPQLSDKVQATLRCGGESRDVAGVLRNLGLDEHDMQGSVEGARSEARTLVFGHGLVPEEGLQISGICGASPVVRWSKMPGAFLFMHRGRGLT